MLPFLKANKAASVIIAKRTADATPETLGEQGEENHGLLSACDDIIRAIGEKDSKALAAALRAADDCMDDAQEMGE